MDYRREIDGLRALAVVPVILFHAGYETFRGGFVGVDVFFVISGYLITTIILSELEQGKFSIANFYERRARRILPALFPVMGASLIVGYFTLMPDEFKNLGQSLVTTSLFSNNLLLAMTSGYWDLASEFKPLLHTWSLGVEEQYYVIVPLLLLFAWKYFREKIPLLLVTLFVGSFCFAIWFITVSPDWAFYILPTRAWEIAIGALAATFLRSHPTFGADLRFANTLSLLGLLLILLSIFVFDETYPSPGWYLLLPTIGAILIILYARKGTAAQAILGQRALVFLGLISYSLYLWHQPIFSFLRVYFVDRPGPYAFGVSMLFILGLAYLSWKYIEGPFRNKTLIGRSGVLWFSSAGTAFFIVAGLYLNSNYGIPNRVFDSTVRIEDMDKRIYNERIFDLKKDSFAEGENRKLLIIGNSFARDFTNITLETYDTSKLDIVYRNDLSQCILPYKDEVSQNLFSKADAVVFASGGVKKECLDLDLEYAASNHKMIYYVGGKDFGYNLNWLIRLNDVDRRDKYNAISHDVIASDIDMARIVPASHYISLLSPTLVGDRVPITDELGRMLSTDRAHLTKYGAIFFGDRAVKKTGYSRFFDASLPMNHVGIEGKVAIDLAAARDPGARAVLPAAASQRARQSD